MTLMRRALLVLTAAAGLALAGCGGSSGSSNELDSDGDGTINIVDTLEACDDLVADDNWVDAIEDDGSCRGPGDTYEMFVSTDCADGERFYYSTNYAGPDNGALADRHGVDTSSFDNPDYAACYYGAAGPEPTAAGSSTAPAAADYRTPADVARALQSENIGCDDPNEVTVQPRDRSYLEAAATCSVDGETVALATFSSAGQRAEYMRIGQAGTGAYPYYVLGSTWAVATLTRATASNIAAAIGGQMN